MTLQDIADRVKKIKEYADENDNEVAHKMEDDLWYDVLKDIAGECQNPTGFAKEAIKTVNIKFSRCFS